MMIQLRRSVFPLVALLACGVTLVAAEEVTPASQDPAAKPGFFPLQMLRDAVDYLPDLVERNLPTLDPTGAYRITVRPHFGDFLNRDYVRIPLGLKAKVSEFLELNSEVEGYVTHGLDGSAGYGFSMARLGAKYETTLGDKENIGFSSGLHYDTPLGHPPRELTDGMRRLQPYIAFSKPLSPRWGLIGFGTMGLSLLSSSPIPPNFGKNQLHTNSMGFAVGVSKGWKYFHTSITGTVISGALMSDEAKQVYDLKPEITVPLRMLSGPRANILLRLTGHATSGPDGEDFGIGSSVRVELKFRHRQAPGSPSSK